VASRPQPPVPQSVPQFFEPPAAPEPLRRLWTSALAAASLIFAALGRVFKEIAARWRGIVLAHIFFLTLWLALQVFFFASGAYWCFPNEGSKFVEWFSRYFPQVSRCGPPAASHDAPPSRPPFAVSSHDAASSRTPFAVSSFGWAKGAPPSSASSDDASASSAGASPTSSSPSPAPSSPASSTASAAGSASAWSSKSIANCWRNRSVGSGSCFGRAEAHPKRFRYPTYPCRRPSECGWRAAS
jgi:hypothetical protein